MHDTIVSLVGTYGYLVVFLAVGLESLGIPLPGETALVTAAAFAARGHLSIIAVIAVAAIAAILGDNGGYWIGRRGGVALVRRRGRLLHLDERKLERVRTFFARYGAKTVFIGRFIALLRTWAAFFAGAGAMPYGEFMLYNALGGVTWAVLFGTLGYVFGRNLPTLERYVGRASLALVLLAALIAVLVILWRRVGLSIVVARFTSGTFLGRHLTVGLFVSLAALWLFAAITEDVVHNDPLTVFDIALAHQFRTHATPLGDRVFYAITLLGSSISLGGLCAAVASTLAWRRHWLAFWGWIAAFGGGSAIDWTLKHLIRRPRPPYAEAYYAEHSFSFPSGHATMSLIAFSRLYLGVHYFSDVVGGFAAATVWLAACVSGVEISRRSRSETATDSSRYAE